MKQELYFVALIPPEELEREIYALKVYMSEKYSTHSSLKSPAHITIQSPFRYPEEQQSELIHTFRQFKIDHAGTKILLEDFSSFPPSTIFVNVKESASLDTLHREWNHFSAAKLRIKSTTNTPFRPHITIANRDITPGNFEVAITEFNGKKFSGSFYSDQLHLLKLVSGKWTVLESILLV